MIKDFFPGVHAFLIILILNQGVSHMGLKKWFKDGMREVLVEVMTPIETKIDGIDTKIDGLQIPDMSGEFSVVNDKLDSLQVLALLREMGIGALALRGTFGDIVTLRIITKGEPLRDFETQGIGVDIVFDNAILEYQGVRRGDLILDWGAIDANIQADDPNRLRVGAYPQTGTPLSGEFLGSLCEVDFMVVGNASSILTLENYVDILTEMRPNPCIVDFTFISE